MYKENISATYNASYIKIEQPPPIYDRDTKNKAEGLDRLQAAMKEKLVTASNTEKLQILTLVPDSWSRKCCFEYLKVFTNESGQFYAISMNCFMAGSSGTHLVYVCTTHQNTVLLVDALNWEVTYKDLINKVVCDPSNCECIMHRCTNCPGTNALRKFLEKELSDIDPGFQFHYSQW